MNTQHPPLSQVVQAAVLANAYQLLAVGFAYPSSQLFEVTTDGTLYDELLMTVQAISPDHYDAATGWCDALHPSDHLTLESEYLSAFELDAPKRSISPYEGSYIDGCDRAKILLEVKAFYQHFGLSMSDNLREIEDQLAAELEFMQFLTAKQAIAEDGNGDAGPYIRAQRDFLSRHLIQWISRFEAATTKIDSTFYKALAWFANVIVTAHHDLLCPQSGKEDEQ